MSARGFAARLASLSARIPCADDADFLAALYLSTRTDLDALPVPRAVVEGIARHQQALQREAYAQACPQAEEGIVEDGAGPLGRLVLDRRPGELRVVDLSVAPRARRRGHARALLLALQAEAVEEGRALALRVRADNAAARSLYAGLGFQTLPGGGARLELRWQPNAQWIQKE